MRSDNRRWCGGQNDEFCNTVTNFDVRIGDITSDASEEQNPGDFTHPSAHGLGQVADELVNFVYGDSTRSPFLSWIKPPQ